MPNEHQPRVPADLSHFVDKGLAKDPNHRYQSIAEMRQRLQLMTEGYTPVQCPITFSKRMIYGGLHLLDRWPMQSMALAAASLLGLAGARVAVLGAAYRGGVKETAFSGVFPLVHALRERGAIPLVHDPMYTDAELVALGLNPVGDAQPDAVIIQTDHPEYLEWGVDTYPTARVIYDGRNALDDDRWEGRRVLVIGRPSPQ